MDILWGEAAPFATTENLSVLALGKCRESPFDQATIERVRHRLVGCLSEVGIEVQRKSGDRDELPFDWRLFSALLRAAEDPDFEQLGEMAQGIPIGVGVALPRVPAL